MEGLKMTAGSGRGFLQSGICFPGNAKLSLLDTWGGLEGGGLRNSDTILLQRGFLSCWAERWQNLMTVLVQRLRGSWNSRSQGRLFFWRTCDSTKESNP